MIAKLLLILSMVIELAIYYFLYNNSANKSSLVTRRISVVSWLNTLIFFMPQFFP